MSGEHGGGSFLGYTVAAILILGAGVTALGCGAAVVLLMISL